MDRKTILHYSKALIGILVIGYIQLVYVADSDVPTYENGQPKSYGSYENGLPDGKWVWWFEDGSKMSEGYFKAGKRNGIGTTWYFGGAEKSKGMYKNDMLEGVYKKWHRNGVIAFEGRYSLDKLEGVQKYYSNTGELEKTEQYSKGILNESKSSVIEKCLPITDAKYSIIPISIAPQFEPIHLQLNVHLPVQKQYDLLYKYAILRVQS